MPILLNHEHPKLIRVGFMQNINRLRSFSLAFCACAALIAGAPAFAQHSGGGHSGGGWHGGGGVRGGLGWAGGYGLGGGYFGPRGWGLGGLGLGLYFAKLP